MKTGLDYWQVDEVAELGIPNSGVHDVCRLLNQHGILALHVLRKDPSAGDLSAERDGRGR